MAVLDTLTEEVGALLGMSSLSGNTVPSLTQVERWVLAGQRDLAARLVPDAIPELWQEKTQPSGDPLPLVPGARVISVAGGGKEARHISATEAALAGAGGSLFGADSGSPVWHLTSSSRGSSKIVVTPILSVKILYVEPPQVVNGEEEDVLLATHLHPLIVRYAFYMAKLADEDDAGAQIAWQDYTKAISDVNQLHVGRQGVITVPGSMDGAS
jgi:hypothetical protein